MRRKIRDEHEAEELLYELVDSGEAISDFCRRRGIDGRSLNCWRMNLERDRSAGEGFNTVRLVELTTAVAASTYRLSVNDVVIEVEDDFREQTLTRLLRAARAC